MSYNVNPINRMPVFKKLGASGCEEPTNQVQVIGNINVPMPMQAPNTFQAPSVPHRQSHLRPYRMGWEQR